MNKRHIMLGANLTAITLSLVLIATYLAHWVWFFELISHFRIQILVGLLATAIILLLGQQWQTASASLFIILLSVIPLIPFYFSSTAVGAAQNNNSYRLMALNVYFHSTAYDDVLALIDQTNPDIIILSEFTDAWRDGLRSLTIDYPYTHYVADDWYGQMIYSRIPFVAGSLDYLADEKRPSVVATLDMEGVHLTVVGVHAMPPVSPDHARQRNQKLDSLAQFTQAQTNPVLIVGDLNITPWSPILRQFLIEANLGDARRGYGLAPTWPAQRPIIGIPIDYILVPPTLKIQNFQRGPYVGSDHYPIMADFSLAE